VTFQERLVDEALKQIGAPYIWAAKGDKLWTPAGLKPLVNMPLAFDCIGLITYAIWRAGGPDWRGTENAQTMFEHMRSPDPVPNNVPHLRYYGKDQANITHIALALYFQQTAWLVCEAAGGGHLTNTITPGAKVFCHFERRADFVGVTNLPVF
jgi:cell wall-associated NlpC family hydrolase